MSDPVIGYYDSGTAVVRAGARIKAISGRIGEIKGFHQDPEWFTIKWEPSTRGYAYSESFHTVNWLREGLLRGEIEYLDDTQLSLKLDETCTCNSRDLANFGCKCGYWERNKK